MELMCRAAQRHTKCSSRGYGRLHFFRIDVEVIRALSSYIAFVRHPEAGYWSGQIGARQKGPIPQG